MLKAIVFILITALGFVSGFGLLFFDLPPEAKFIAMSYMVVCVAATAYLTFNLVMNKANN